jgi:hypothetical protein
LSKINIILRDLEEIDQDLMTLRSEIENLESEISPKDKEKLLEKHVELATSFGVLETTLNRMTSQDY